VTAFDFDAACMQLGFDAEKKHRDAEKGGPTVVTFNRKMGT